MLVNNANRKIDYLRISVTDRCNLRCMYCMPNEGIEHVGSKEVLSFEEVLRLVRIFLKLGISKIRITGGEPLVRKGVVGLIQSITKIQGIEEVALTTNAVLLPEYAKDLKKAGVRRLNISLDTLKRDKFRKLTRRDFFRRAIDGIDKAKEAQFQTLKLNIVVMKGINDDEITDFVEFAISKNLILRFIEFMEVTPLWEEALFMPIDEIKKICQKKYKLERIENPGPSPAEHYKIDDMPILGFIKTDQNNCNKCSRLRLTSVGELKICLYEHDGLLLRGFLRDGMDDDAISNIIRKRICMKEGVDYRFWDSHKMYMCSLGG